MNKYILYPCVYGIMAVTTSKNISVKVDNHGKINIKSIKTNKKIKFLNRFLVRGMFFLIFGIYYTICGICNDNLEFKSFDRTKKSLNVSYNSILTFIMIILTLFISFFLLGFIPTKLSYYLAPKNYNIFTKRMIITLMKLAVIFLMFLILKSFIVCENYLKFNESCHKLQKSQGQVNFLYFFLCSTFLDVLILGFVGLPITSWYFVIVNILISVVIFSVNYELFLQIQKNKWLNAIIFPICWLFYEKPSLLEEKCVNIILNELKLSNSKRDKMQEEVKNGITFSEAYVQMQHILKKANRYEKSDLDYIFAEVLNKSRAEVRLVKTINITDYKKIQKIVEERASGKPITKILGHTNFYGLEFIVTKDVLSPRMDTERLVETVLNDIKPKQTVIDIGTGSGAIAITIAKNSQAKVTAVDISEDALKVAKENAKNNNVQVKFVESNLFDAFRRFTKFDVIVSNPPYIPSKVIDNLEDEVKKFDPIIALDGGADGLDFYKKIIDEAPKRLTRNGKIYFEVGINQALDVKKLLQKNFKDIRIVKDYNKIDRVVCATLI